MSALPRLWNGEPGTPGRVWIAAIVVAAIQTIVLGYMIASRAALLAGGAEVLLHTAPVDPRDLLRGDYVALSYDISRVPVATLTGGIPPSAIGRTLNVRLERQADGFWAISESSFAPLPAKEGSVILRSLPLRYQPLEGEQVLTVDYGIERFYLPEGEGHTLEGAPMNGRVSVAVRVGSDGEGLIRRLMLDGRPLYDEPLY